MPTPDVSLDMESVRHMSDDEGLGRTELRRVR
jgi:hypothetical protein